MTDQSGEHPEPVAPPGFTPVRGRKDVVVVEQPAGVSGRTEYAVWGWVEPPEYFGLPNGENVVFPSTDEWVTAHWPLEGGGIRWGTLSRYRDENEAIDETFDLGADVHGEIKDNNIVVTVSAETAHDAVHAAMHLIETYLANVSVSTGAALRFKLAGAQVVNGPSVRVLRNKFNYRATLYGLEKTREAFRRDQTFVRVVDARLERALQYYMHAEFLKEIANTADRRENDFYLIQSSIFLNLWKAVTVIVGDAGERDFQSRYKKLGLDREFFTSEIEWMKSVRDDQDVAHYRVGPDPESTLQQIQHRGTEIAQRVIDAYRNALAAGTTF